MNWVVVVDDDIANLKMAGVILSKNNMRVTALRSGAALLEYVKTNRPDLILLDIRMPDMDGFATLKRLREQDDGGHEIPVVFLTADEHEDSEARALQAGAVDYIRKPFEPGVLVSRVRRIIETQERINQYEHDVHIDSLTGCLNKGAIEEKMEVLCREESGMVCVLDLDSFKLVNDLCGHEVGDNTLRAFAQKLRKNLRSDDVCGRIGGDEFIIFARNMKAENELSKLYDRINRDFSSEFARLLGSRSEIPLGVSLGAAAVPALGRDYAALFRLADQALASVKQNGKHGWKLAGQRDADGVNRDKGLDLEAMTAILEERNISYNAMWMGRDAFVSIYRYMVRYMERYHGMAYRVLFTVKTDVADDEARRHLLTQFRLMTQRSLRNSDVMMEAGDDRLFLLLPEAHDYDIDRVVTRLLRQWEKSEYGRMAAITYETGQVHLSRNEQARPVEETRYTVVIVDDDPVNLKLAEQILTREKMQVKTLTSGEALLDYVKGEKPDLILLDVRMPEMDGFETMDRLKELMKPGKEIPVVFLTSDEKRETEIRALQSGAMDLIRKPFSEQVLILRVRHTIEHARLQRNLAAEVDRKTRENENLLLHVVQTLAEAIDAKDAYTNGHSGRVAKYARELARRFGYDEEQQDSIYMTGLLHDVGKIGVADAIINKPGRLTQEEYAVIKTHSVTGSKILRQIKEKPELSVVARWHHERYDGKGYPDGLSGKEIPEAARIIAVADAYDAMTSHRSYRDSLSQSAVRAEIERGRGTQFDPLFADIMLKIIDEDTEFELRES